MSNLKNTYGFSQSLLDAIRSVQENALKGNQPKLDANKNGKIDAEDFKKLRAMKKEEIEQIDEISLYSDNEETGRDNEKRRMKGPSIPPLRGKPLTRPKPPNPPGFPIRKPSSTASYKKEEVDLEEGGMPSSVIRTKQKYAAMTNQEFADLHGHKTEDELRQMAWSHGYGKMSPHYWNRVQKAKATQMKEEVDLEEGGNPRSNLYVGTVKRSDSNYDEKIDELIKKTTGGHRIRGRAPTPEHKHLYAVGGKLHRYSSQDIKPEHSSHVDVYSRNPMKEEVEQLEEAQNLIPLISQLKALLSWLVSSGAIRKFAKEEADVVGMLELLEYRTKGAVGKKNRPAASKESGESHNETGETKKQEHDEDMPDAYARASRDGRHVIPELSDAAQDKEGGTMQSSNGERPVSQKVAQLFHDHLMKMKPAERAEHSAHIFNGKVPNVKTLNHIKTARLISQMGSEKKIGSDEGVKRGRGRPKKVQ
jgi:hypothetical protein